MESRIPSMSVRKPPAKPISQISRLPAPSTVGRKPASCLRPPTFTGIKRPLETGSTFANKRMAPMSLLKASSTSNPHSTFPRFGNPMATREIAAALNDEPDGVFQTPYTQKENKCFNTSYEKLVRSSPIPVPSYTPVKKIVKEDKEMNTDIEWATFDKETEISLYKTQIASIQKSLTESESREREFKNEIEVLKLQAEKIQSEFDHFKSVEQNSKTEASQAALDKEAAFVEERGKLFNDIFDLQAKVAEESRLKIEADARLNVLESEILQIKMQLEKAVAEGELKDSSLEDANNKVEAFKLRENEFTNTQQELNYLKSEISRLEEKEKLAGIFSDELKDVKVIEDENRVLKLKLESLQETCSRTKLLEEQIAQKESENIYLQSQVNVSQEKIEALGYTQIQLNDWQTKLGSESPDEFKTQLATLQQDNLILSGENEFQKNSIALLKEQIECHANKYKEIDEELQHAQIKVHEQDQALHEFEEKAAFLEKQNEMLTERSEETSAQKIEICEQLSAQIEQLNTDVKGYKVILSEKEKEIITLKTDKQSLEGLVQQRNDMINNLNKQIHALQAKIEEDSVARTEKDMESDVRVISLQSNPFRVAEEEREKCYTKLVEENARLNSLIEVLQSEENKADMTMQINNVLEKNSIIAKLEVEKAKCRKVLDKERENNHQLIRKLRSHVTDLTGYKVYMDKLYQTVTLRHTFDERFKATFNFTEDSKIELVSGPKAECCPRVEEYIQTHLLQGGGYPVFLAALTLDMFNQRL